MLESTEYNLQDMNRRIEALLNTEKNFFLKEDIGKQWSEVEHSNQEDVEAIYRQIEFLFQ